MDDLLTLHTARVDGPMVIAATGEVDVVSAALLIAAIADAVASHDGEIWLDLTGLDFIDSSGLSAVLQLEEARRGTFAVICPAGPIRRVFEVAGVLNALPIYRSRDEAIADGH